MNQYNPARAASKDSNDPLEVELVYNVAACGSCSFFWPEDGPQTYGPYPSFDFNSNTPDGNAPNGTDYVWLKGTTTEESFPTGEVMDGCRKAPIMTIGINPNLTAFAPGRMGTGWAYPNFTSNNGTDEWIKYAFYYRYRSVYQEHFDFNEMKKYLLKEGEIVAVKNGVLVNVIITSEDPNYDIEVLYEGDTEPTKISVKWDAGTPRYVLLYDRFEPTNKFSAGDVIAAKLSVPAGVELDVYQGQIGYYEQFVPTLQGFEQFLKEQGNTDVNLQIGEDVCQLDMVACASPHWNKDYLGHDMKIENDVIHNCVSKNAWAMKQLVQTRPVVLFLVGEASYNMFNGAFGGLIKKNTPLPAQPEDGAFTLFRQTLDSTDPTMFEFETTIDGLKYNISTRLVITPHFSYSSSFLPQFRMSYDGWAAFEKKYPECYTFFFNDSRFQYTAPAAGESGFVGIMISKDSDLLLKALEKNFKAAYDELQPYFYRGHDDMGQVLKDLYKEGKLNYQTGSDGKPGYLSRTEGSCKFCINDHWSFPLGCPYGKTSETPPPPGFLRKVADAIVKGGRNAKPLFVNQ